MGHLTYSAYNCAKIRLTIYQSKWRGDEILKMPQFYGEDLKTIIARHLLTTFLLFLATSVYSRSPLLDVLGPMRDEATSKETLLYKHLSHSVRKFSTTSRSRYQTLIEETKLSSLSISCFVQQIYESSLIFFRIKDNIFLDLLDTFWTP